MNARGNAYGFTMVEFLLVVAISAILIVGLAAVVEVPRQMAEDEQTQVHVSVADRALAQLERDIRFCRDALVPQPTRLELTQRDGTTVIYEWDGVQGHPFVRTDANGSAELVTATRDVSFAVTLAPLTIRTDAAENIETTSVEVASFEHFLVAPSYYVKVDGVALTADTTGLTETVQEDREYEIGKYKRAGIVVVANISGGGGAEAGGIRLRAKRRDNRDLKVEVYGVTGFYQPDYSNLVATGKVANGSLPLDYQDVVIPLTTHKKLQDGEWYFVKLLSDYLPTDTTGYAAKVQYCVLDKEAAALSDNVGFLTSDDWTKDFVAAAGADGNMAATGIEFTFEATISNAVFTEGEVEVQQIPVAVAFRLALEGPDDDQVIRTSIPIENNIALVTQ